MSGLIGRRSSMLAPPRTLQALSARPALAAATTACVMLTGFNWALAHAVRSPVFAYSSAMLFGWFVLLMTRWLPRAAILAMPLIITRAATVISLIFIEGGAYMPEIGRVGAPGDASASFVFVSALFFTSYAIVFFALDRIVSMYARSRIVGRLAVLLRWPVIGICAVLAGLVLLQGSRTGFPLLHGVDRFLYRRFYGEGAVLLLLENKSIVAAVLGSMVFSTSTTRLEKAAAATLFLSVIVECFLFGDKFFTILSAAAYFAMPGLLLGGQAMRRAIPRILLAGSVLLAAVVSITVYIYSDYGTLPMDRASERLAERVAGQGELWFVATQDAPALLDWKADEVQRYVGSLQDKDPGSAAFADGADTYYFIFKYAPQKLKDAFKANQGWVQYTMGFEAIGLVMFGYVGLTLLVTAAGALAALFYLFLYRAFLSENPLSIVMASWASMQIYMAVQQASLWAVFATGQWRRFFLFAVVETCLAAVNRGEAKAKAHRLAFDRPVALDARRDWVRRHSA
jgi:hypothetical protein